MGRETGSGEMMSERCALVPNQEATGDMRLERDIVCVEFGETETLDDRRLLLAYGQPEDGDAGWWLFWVQASDETRKHCLPGVPPEDQSQAVERARDFALQNHLL